MFTETWQVMFLSARNNSVRQKQLAPFQSQGGFFSKVEKSVVGLLMNKLFDYGK